MKKLIRYIIQKVFKIQGIHLFFKKWKKKILKNVYTKKYTAGDIVDIMKQMGMGKGSIVFIHSSMTEFYNYKGDARELIDKIIEVIGEEGTLMMPCYPKNKKQIIKNCVQHQIADVVFDVNATPSGAGYLSEVFRTYPGVKRSINIQHSVCAWGKLSDYFISEHHLSETCWDEKSPYYKMSQKDETLVFALGLSYFLGTMIHCVESLLRFKYRYFTLFFERKVTYTYRDKNGNISTHTMRTDNVERKRSKKKIIKKYFDKNEFHVKTISNLRVEMVRAKYTLDLMLHLAEEGITMYSKPSPKPYLKDGHFIRV